MLKKLAALAGAAVAFAALVLGYQWAATGQMPVGQRQLAGWASDSVRIAIALSGYPLLFEEGGQASGFAAELLRQAPMAGATWHPVQLSEQEAVAAVGAQSVDLALLCVLRDGRQGPLSYSEPILTSDLCLFSPAPMTAGIAGRRVAWSGPAGIAELLLRSGAEPVTVASTEDCLARAVAGDVEACAADRAVGTANVARLQIGEDLLISGEPLATLDYVLAWRQGDRAAAAPVAAWLGGLRSSGASAALRQKWLGTPIAAAPAAVQSPLAPVLAAVSGLSLLATGALALRNRSLRRSMRSRSSGWLDSTRRYQALVDGANDAIFVLTLEQGSILEANQRAAELSGYARESLERMQFGQLLPARHKRLLREWLLDSGETGRIEEVPLVRSDGSVATVEISSRVVTGEGRDVRLCVVRNVTEHKHMQREIRRVTQFSERILENMTNGVVTVDVNGLITSYNRTVAALVGGNGQAIGRPLDEVLATRGQSLGQLVQSAIGKGEMEKHTVLLASSGGADVSNNVTISLLRDEQVISGAILVFTDTSQEARASEEWQRLAMLSALGEVSGVLAHDLRNRVSGVHVGVQFLADKFPPEDPRRESMKYIRGEMDGLVQVIDDILMLIRPGKTTRSACRVGDVLERVVRAAVPSAQKAHVEIIAASAPDTPVVSADPVQLERALGNLVKNALEAMPAGGQVRLTSDAVVEERDGKRARLARIRVSDDGPGIPAAIRTKLFRPFVSEKKGGTGLGLSIVKRIIDEHGGHIEVESREGQGTTFTILLPAVADRGTR